MSKRTTDLHLQVEIVARAEPDGTILWRAEGKATLALGWWVARQASAADALDTLARLVAVETGMRVHLHVVGT